VLMRGVLLLDVPERGSFQKVYDCGARILLVLKRTL
jgi:hypothetical protein